MQKEIKPPLPLLSIILEGAYLTRKIDPEKIASGDLTEDERLYLQDRGLLPEGVEKVDNDYSKPASLDSRPNTGTANTAGVTTEEFEEQLEKSKKAQTVQPVIQDKGGIEVIEDDETIELDYDEMNNNERRAELSRRGLAVTGNKEELISRLRRSDMDELLEGDKAEE